MRFDELHVLVREVATSRLLGEIEIPVDDAPYANRNSEERPHGWVARREADGPRILGQVVKPERSRVPDDGAEDPAPERRLAELGPRSLVDPGRDEALEPEPALVEDTQRRIPRSGDRSDRVDNALEQIVERQLRAERDARVDQATKTIRLREVLIGPNLSDSGGPRLGIGVRQRGYTRHSPPT